MQLNVQSSGGGGLATLATPQADTDEVSKTCSAAQNMLLLVLRQYRRYMPRIITGDPSTSTALIMGTSLIREAGLHTQSKIIEQINFVLAKISAMPLYAAIPSTDVD